MTMELLPRKRIGEVKPRLEMVKAFIRVRAASAVIRQQIVKAADEVPGCEASFALRHAPIRKTCDWLRGAPGGSRALRQ